MPFVQRTGGKPFSVHYRFDDVLFGVYSASDIKQLNVCEISNPNTFDILGLPTTGGVYDRRLGPSDDHEKCSTCGNVETSCPGHMGFICLPLPVYNPVFFKLAYQLIRGSCLSCGRLLNGESVPAMILKAQLQLVAHGQLTEANELASIAYQVTNWSDEAEEVGFDDDPIKEKRRRLEPCTSDGRIREAIQTKLAHFMTTQSGDGKDDDATRCKHSVRDDQTRSQIDMRHQLLRNFQRNYLFKRMGKCPHCTARVPAVRNEYNRTLLLGRANLEASAASKRKKASADRNTLDADASQWFLPDECSDTPDGQNELPPEGISLANESALDLDSTDGATAEDINTRTEEMASEQLRRLVRSSLKGEGVSFLSPHLARIHLRKVWRNDGALLSEIFPTLSQYSCGKDMGCCPLDILFMESLPVTPSRFRPVNRMHDKCFENGRSVMIRKVLDESITIRSLLNSIEHSEDEKSILARYGGQIHGRSSREMLQISWIKLQSRVNLLFDSDLDKSKREPVPDGIKQELDGKQGIFRKHMMGKRVNYVARSVITPDPYIDIDEIGIPHVFARKLVYAEPVTSWNVSYLRRLVAAGPSSYPGANFVIDENHKTVLLSSTDRVQREAIAKRLYSSNPHSIKGPKKVIRFVRNGDVFLLNRQPTLHKPSIMAHRARVLPGEQTLRLNYASCKTYNADFDGDEMNAHFPQSEVARSEGYNIASVRYQYLVPKDGSPISGLIQDHVVAGVLLTKRDVVLTKEDYCFLVSSAFGNRFKKMNMLPPAYLKPLPRWTGKQVLSTIIRNIIPKDRAALHLVGKAKTSVNNWQVVGHDPPSLELSESSVVIRDGELLCGVLDKAHYGATAYGLVHTCYELYGSDVSSKLLSCFGRLFTTFLQLRGFTLGVQDLLLDHKADKKRVKILRKAADSGVAVARELLRLDDYDDLTEALSVAYATDPLFTREMDFAMKKKTDNVTNDINVIAIPRGLIRKFPENNLQLMIESGAKGSMVNAMQLSCALGQIELEGARPPLTASSRTLPSFGTFDSSLRAGGFVTGRFLTGIKCQEYFFHCMAGREGLIDTAVKTSSSGYLQRSIIKHLEALVIGYDLSVRDSDSSVIQFQYGEDCLDVCKSSFLKESQFPLLAANVDAIDYGSDVTRIRDIPSDNGDMAAYSKKVVKWKKKDQLRKQSRHDHFLAYYTKMAKTGLETSEDVKGIIDKWRSLDDSQRQKYKRVVMEPVTNTFRPDRHFGSLPESLESCLNEFVKKHCSMDRYLTVEDSQKLIEKQRFVDLIHWKAIRALADPGEAVGLLAAQSIGEPSTQMTLNTFHFAGRGEMNVTLGIPRLREILMSGTCKLPSARVPFRPGVTKESAQTVTQKLDRTYLKEVLKKIKIQESLCISEIRSARRYHIVFQILRQKFRPANRRALSCPQIVRYIERNLLKQISVTLQRRHDDMVKSSIISHTGGQKRAFGRDMDIDQDGEAEGTGGDRPAGRDEDDNLADEAGDDIGLSEGRIVERHSDANEYVGEEEEHADVAPSEDEEESDDEDEESSDGPHIGDSIMESMEAGSLNSSISAPSKKTVDLDRVQAANAGAKLMVSYDYDVKHERWCSAVFELPLHRSKLDFGPVIESVMKNAIVRSVPKIEKALCTEENGQLFLQTQGINLQALYQHQEELDVRQIRCNDVRVMAQIYGIEAAARTIISEMTNVFGGYGIYVNFRHLSLIADYMAQSGIYRSFNRFNMAVTPSPWQRVTFETCMSFLREAVLSGDKDTFSAPSAQLIGGLLPATGTGTFELKAMPFVLK